MKFDTKSTSLMGAAVGIAGAIGISATLGTDDAPVGALLGASAPLSGDAPDTFCLLTDAPYFTGLKKGCYSKTKLAALQKEDLLNRRGDRIEVTMTSPPEAAESSDKCRTCEDYNRMRRLGWFALSGRDQRREAFFQRACGLLEYLEKATPPTRTNFANGTLDADALAAVAPAAFLKLSGARPGSRTGTVAPGVAGDDNPAPAIRWMDDAEGYVIAAEDQTVVVQPLVHADFDGDTLGDVLAYTRTRMNEGSAFAGTIGYFSRTEAAGPVTFSTQ
ncbi:MAG: hypothetical protein AAFR20_08375 [Pseudomonadota bacterium]